MKRALLSALLACVGSFADVHPVRAQDTPKRIVSIGGDITETLYALGFAERIIAVDATSQFPPEALRDKTNVGYMRALSAEGVLSVGAQMIVASDKAGPADVVKALKASTIYIEIAESLDPAAVPEKIEAIARAVGASEAGERLAVQVGRELEALAALRAKIDAPMRALFVLNVQNGRVIVGGADTNADAMLRLCGLENAAKEVRGYKPVGDEALLSMKPQVVLVMHTGAGHETDQLGAVAGLRATPAGSQDRIVIVDANDFLGMGPRIARTARAMMERVYGIPSSPKGN